ncbi:MAG: SDR family NAD(P)-dependent oxidoreductase [Roseiarcus sp.]
MRVEGIAVVTGGASGIGHACCKELAERGASVVVLDRDLAAAEKVADEIGGVAVEADVRDDVALGAAAARIERDHGPVRTLVNSAGIMQIPLPPQSLTLEMYDEVLRVDLRGTYLACVAFGLPMVARRRGGIVNIASVAGLRSMPLHAYAPAKAAVISTTQCLAAEWGPCQVRVNAVCPGYTLTPQLRARIERGERDVTALEANAAMGRLVDPVEIARAVAFLASPLASAITGVSLPVDCGWLVAPSWHSYGGLRAAGAL